ncbi:MAG: hypothetical protein LBG78_02115, partial [Azoarcus sp.]|nr:hypothetical protein [Azoarcus sp.]
SRMLALLFRRLPASPLSPPCVDKSETCRFCRNKGGFETRLYKPEPWNSSHACLTQIQPRHCEKRSDEAI